MGAGPIVAHARVSIACTVQTVAAGHEDDHIMSQEPGELEGGIGSGQLPGSFMAGFADSAEPFETRGFFFNNINRLHSVASQALTQVVAKFQTMVTK